MWVKVFVEKIQRRATEKYIKSGEFFLSPYKFDNKAIIQFTFFVIFIMLT